MASQTLRSRPFILVPLYIYPGPKSWEPLFTAARAHPALNFVVVVNPDNGPGSSPAPDCNYQSVLEELSTLKNVTILGYIYCSYGDRPLLEIEADIQVYKGWSSRCLSPVVAQKRNMTPPEPFSDATMRVDGIFIDETPPGRDNYDYLASISRFTMETLRGTGVDSPIVIHNPGIFVHPTLYKLADYVVVFENAASEWGSKYVRQNLARLPQELRSRSLAIAHSHGCLEEQLRFCKDVVSCGFAGHFSTGMPGYTRFCANWEDYIRDSAGWAGQMQC